MDTKNWVDTQVQNNKNNADYYFNEASEKLFGVKVLQTYLPKIDAAYAQRNEQQGGALAPLRRLVRNANWWTHGKCAMITLRNVGTHEEWVPFENPESEYSTGRYAEYEITHLDQQRFVHSVKDALGVEGKKAPDGDEALKVVFEFELWPDEKCKVEITGYTPPTCRKVKMIEQIAPTEQPTTREVIKIACTDDEVEKLLSLGGVLVGV